MSTVQTMKYLFNENPLVIDRELAVVIGLNEAMILQQMQYWIKKSEHEHDSKIWIYNSVNQWKKQFPFFSESTINRSIKNLEAKGLLFVGNYNKDRRDLTRWYSINYSELNAVMKNAISQNDQMQQVNLTSPLPEITTEITNNKKINKKDSFDPISVKPKNLSVEAWSKWVEYRKEKGKKLTETSWRKHIELLESQNNPEAIIDKSILSGWIGLFPEKHGGKKPSAAVQPKQSGMTPERQREYDQYLFMNGLT